MIRCINTITEKDNMMILATLQSGGQSRLKPTFHWFQPIVNLYPESGLSNDSARDREHTM